MIRRQRPITTARILRVCLLAWLSGLALSDNMATPALGIWSAPMQAGWPTVLAAIMSPSLSTLTAKAKFTWQFPAGDTNGCTSRAEVIPKDQPCTGWVVDHVFATTGTYTVQLTVTDSSLASPITVQSEVVVPATAPPRSQTERAELRQVPVATWDRMVQGLYQLKALGVYDHFGQLHRRMFTQNVVPNSGTNRGGAHSGPAFLVWHRALTRVVEVCLQVAMNDTALGLPYVDWQQSYDGLERYLGPDGNPSNHLVSAGPFCNDPAQTDPNVCPKQWVLPDDYPDPVKAIRRQFGSDPNYHLLTDAEWQALMSIGAYDDFPLDETPTPTSLRNALEGWNGGATGGCHNGFHRWMGGTMGQVTESFNDPMFLFHHSQVDRVFTVWQQQNGCADGHGSTVCYRPGDGDPMVNASLPGVTQAAAGQYTLPGHMYSDAMFPWGLRPRDLLAAEQGYHFLDPQQQPKALTLPPDVPTFAPPPNSLLHSPSTDQDHRNAAASTVLGSLPLLHLAWLAGVVAWLATLVLS